MTIERLTIMSRRETFRRTSDDGTRQLKMDCEIRLYGKWVEVRWEDDGTRAFKDLNPSDKGPRETITAKLVDRLAEDAFLRMDDAERDIERGLRHFSAESLRVIEIGATHSEDEMVTRIRTLQKLEADVYFLGSNQDIDSEVNKIITKHMARTGTP